MEIGGCATPFFALANSLTVIMATAYYRHDDDVEQGMLLHV